MYISLFSKMILFSLILFTVCFYLAFKKTKKNNQKDDEIVTEIRLNPDSPEYKAELEKLVRYNKRQNKIGYIVQILFVISFFIYAVTFPKSIDLIMPSHIGVSGFIHKLYESLLYFLIPLFLVVYYLFDFPPLGRSSYIWKLESDRDSYHFPDVIRPYLVQGSDKAWEYIMHRNDPLRKRMLWVGSGFLMFYLIFFGDYMIKTMEDIMLPLRTTQMCFSDMHYTDDSHFGGYHLNFTNYTSTEEFQIDDETSNVFYSNNDYSYLFFPNLTEEDMLEVAQSLLPYLDMGDHIGATWEEAKAAMLAGETLRPKTDSKTPVCVEVTGYLNTEVLFSIEVLNEQQNRK